MDDRLHVFERPQIRVTWGRCCPTGALHYGRLDGGAPETTPDRNRAGGA